MPPPEKVETENLQFDSLRVLVYKKIKERILTNRLYPGEQIVIDQMAKQFGVSQTPIREAISSLAADGLVTIEHSKNVRVANITITDVFEVYEMRILLEGWAIHEAASHITPDMLRQLYDRLDRTQANLEQANVDDFLEADIFLHATITGMVKNRMYEKILALIGNQSTRIRSLVEVTQPVETMHQILIEHRDILDAIRAGDTTAASEKMEIHLKAARERTTLALESLTETR